MAGTWSNYLFCLEIPLVSLCRILLEGGVYLECPADLALDNADSATLHCE